MKKKIVGVAGMPGSGKATVVEVALKMGYGIVVMGDEVREETKRRNLVPTPENVGRVMLELRREDGPAAVAKRCVPKIEELGSRIVVVDGVRSLREADEFKKHFPKFKLLAIHSSPETRFKRLFRRKRSDDPGSWETFLQRDSRELHVGVGSVIASADILIVNEGRRAELRKEVQRLLEKMREDG